MPRGGYQPPDPIEHPPLYDWPPRPVAALKWLVADLMFPWGFFLTALAVVTWKWLTPATSTMQTLSPGWMGLIWLRNAVLLTIVAGLLHWWLYIRRSQACHIDKIAVQGASPTSRTARRASRLLSGCVTPVAAWRRQPPQLCWKPPWPVE